jgi:potassium-transporting ATPase KdpC subunit
MKTHFIPCLKLTLLTMILFGLVYPIAITGVSVFAKGQGEGTILEVGGKAVGFEMIGQSFTLEKYFNGRPSAVGYNAASTGGSNKGPSNPEYLVQVEKRIADLMASNPATKKEDIPVDLVTASGGGLDPHISPEAALLQVPRIARSRNMKEEVLNNLVNEHIEKPLFGMLGPSKINVLKLNISLDQIK